MFIVKEIRDAKLGVFDSEDNSIEYYDEDLLRRLTKDNNLGVVGLEGWGYICTFTPKELEKLFTCGKIEDFVKSIPSGYILEVRYSIISKSNFDGTRWKDNYCDNMYRVYSDGTFYTEINRRKKYLREEELISYFSYIAKYKPELKIKLNI